MTQTAVTQHREYLILRPVRWWKSLVSPRSRAARALTIFASAFALVAALWHLATLFSLLRARIALPLDLEWMESGHLYHAWRLAHHLPLYIDPARGFATFPYPPLYWVVIASVGRLFGLDYWTGRAVSIASLALASVILGCALVRHAPTRWLGSLFAVIAAASIGAAFPLSEGSLDLARPDAFATIMPIVAAAIAGDGCFNVRSNVTKNSWWRAFALSIALTASIYAKQTGIFFAMWLIAFVVWRDRRVGVTVAIGTGVLCAAIFGVLQMNLSGWFAIWLFDMRGHGFMVRALLDPLPVFIEHNPILVVLVLVVPILIWRGWLRLRLRPESVKWLGVLGAALVGALLAHAKVGGWRNVYTPVFVLSWPVSLLVACDVLRARWDDGRMRLMASGLIAASGVVLLFLRYEPARYAPTTTTWRSAEQLHSLVTALDGDVVVTTNPFAAIRDGKECSQPILQAYVDAANAGMPGIDFVAALDTSKTEWVIVTSTWLDIALEKELPRAFDHVRDLDHEGSLDTPDASHTEMRSLWRRRHR